MIISSELKLLMEKAAKIRDESWGNYITYSRKVFVPLTNMCRDTCGYCTFVKHPDSPESQILTSKEVLDLAKRGEEKGCKELLFSLGEKPELRYDKARSALLTLGYERLTDYLRDMCAMILNETSLLPHVNAGTLTNEEILSLKPVSASMGMMLETISSRLTKKGNAHFACPDKVPIQRLRTMERMGENKIPFTTGLLIGIGETWKERLEAIDAINNSHRKYGHIQEVIIQNFKRKNDIEMSEHPEPSLEDMLRTIATARIMLAPDISLQAPPNLSDRHLLYLNAGINDWGGISPVSIDFINPERDWPEIQTLSNSTAKEGFKLRERLTVYPAYQGQSKSFLNSNLSDKVNNMRRSDGLALKQSNEFI